MSYAPGPKASARCRWQDIKDSFNSHGVQAIRRPLKAPPPPATSGPRPNREIRVPQVQLIDAEGQNRGVTDIADAIQLAEEASRYLVENVPNATPPVCKILDNGKFLFT